MAPRRIITFDDHQLLDCLPLRIDAIAQDSAALARASLDQLALDDRHTASGVSPSCAASVPAILNWRSRQAA